MLALLVAACAPGAPAPRAASAAGTVPRASSGPVGPGASSPIAGPVGLGVSGGPSGSRYSQRDVQELARVLTGLGRRLYALDDARLDIVLPRARTRDLGLV